MVKFLTIRRGSTTSAGLVRYELLTSQGIAVDTKGGTNGCPVHRVVFGLFFRAVA